ncbi:MAG: sulfatase [Planctomycetota bacterium]
MTKAKTLTIGGVVLAGVAAGVVGAIWLLRPTPPPNVVIVLVDTLRADHTTVHGYRFPTTPNLERIARDGLVLRSHFVNAPWTKPSVASLLTGLHPSAHGSRVGQFETLHRIEEIRAEGRTPSLEILSQDHDTLPEWLRDAGYHTAAFVSNYHMTPRFGYDQGYENYVFTPDERDDPTNVQNTIDALKQSEGPAFVWCHLMAVHDYRYPKEHQQEAFRPKTYTPIDPNAHQALRVEGWKYLETVVADYDNAIWFDDYLLGKLFDYIEREEPNTILIVTSDHGEEFYEHGGFEHVRTLYNELVHVPLVIWGPGVPRGEVQGLTDSVDLLPTLLHRLGIEGDGDLPGQILFTDAGPTAGKAEVFCEKHHRGRQRRFALLADGQKVIVSEHKRTGAQTVELYEDALGPETDDASARADRGDVQHWRERVESWRDRVADRFRRTIGDAARTDLSQYDIEQLKALGYVR